MLWKPQRWLNLISSSEAAFHLAFGVILLICLFELSTLCVERQMHDDTLLYQLMLDLEWTNHIARMEGECWPKRILDWRLYEMKRPIGKPPERWDVDTKRFLIREEHPKEKNWELMAWNIEPNGKKSDGLSLVCRMKWQRAHKQSRYTIWWAKKVQKYGKGRKNIKFVALFYVWLAYGAPKGSAWIFFRNFKTFLKIPRRDVTILIGKY